MEIKDCPQPKFQLFQEVYFFELIKQDNAKSVGVKSNIIMQIKACSLKSYIDRNKDEVITYTYGFDDYTEMKEERIFATKEDLLKSVVQ